MLDRDRLAEVAVDAAGPQGGQTFTYHVPATLADVAAGEAVLVEYGRRRALGIVLAVGRRGEPGLRDQADRGARPQRRPAAAAAPAALAGTSRRHYLAPPALVVRQMLAPGVLERVERSPAAVEATRRGRLAGRSRAAARERTNAGSR